MGGVINYWSEGYSQWDNVGGEMDRHRGRERDGRVPEDMSLLQRVGRMDLCSVRNDWPWCFNSSMTNAPLLRYTK